MQSTYIYQSDFSENNLILHEENMHYLLHVLRAKKFDKVNVGDGLGNLYQCHLAEVGKRHLQLEIENATKYEKPLAQIHLFIAFTKNIARIEWLAEKATEIGLGSITPLLTQRSEKHFTKVERIKKIISAAFCQSQQVYMPLINEAVQLNSSLIEKVKSDIVHCGIAHCMSASNKQHISKVLKKNQDYAIFIGPEGDFTTDEINLCLQYGFSEVHLGNSRLRTETAGLYSVTLFNAIQCIE